MNKQSDQSLKLILAIARRGAGDEICDLLTAQGVNFQAVLQGSGTATNEVVDILGLSGLDKDVVLSVVNAERTGEILRILDEYFHNEKSGGGIAFSIYLSCVGGMATLKYFFAEAKADDKQ